MDSPERLVLVAVRLLARMDSLISVPGRELLVGWFEQVWQEAQGRKAVHRLGSQDHRRQRTQTDPNPFDHPVDHHRPEQPQTWQPDHPQSYPPEHSRAHL